MVNKNCRLCDNVLKKGQKDFCSIEHADEWNKQKKTLKDFGFKK